MFHHRPGVKGKKILRTKALWGMTLVLFSLAFFQAQGYGRDRINLDLVGELNYPGAIHEVRIYRDSIQSRTYACCGTQKGLLVLDITNPESPQKVTFLEIGPIKGMDLFKSSYTSRNYLAILRAQNDVIIFDIEDPAQPVYTGKYILKGHDDPWSSESGIYEIRDKGARNITVSNHHAFIANGSCGLVILDIADPGRPVFLGEYHTTGGVTDISISGTYAYIADGPNGLVVVEISDPAEPVYLGGFGLNNMAWPSDKAGFAAGITISEQCAYLACLEGGLIMIDISQPFKPSLVSWYAPEETDWPVHKAVISGSRAYVAHGKGGIIVLDITSPHEPSEVERRFHTGTEDIRDLDISGNVLCLADRTQGLKTACLDNPYITGEYPTLGHITSIAVAHGLALITDDKHGLRVIDLTNPALPVERDQYALGGEAHDVAVSGDYAYVANGFQGLIAIDIEDPIHPLKGQSGTSGEALGVVISGHYAYVAESKHGLAIYDIADPNNLSLTGRCTPGGDILSV
ncbi:MAG: LVIVD repeat-containing protein, partial [bacterium]